MDENIPISFLVGEFRSTEWPLTLRQRSMDLRAEHKLTGLVHSSWLDNLH